MNKSTFISLSGKRSARPWRLSSLLAAAIMLAAFVQTAVAQNSLGTIGQAVKNSDYNTVYFGIYPQTFFHTVLEAVEYMPPRYPAGPFVVVHEDNQELNGGALSFGRYPRPQATIMNVEPLKWQIVKDDAEGFLLFTDGNVDVQAYNDPVLNPSWNGTWDDASLRDWLRISFLGGQSNSTILSVYRASLTSYANGNYNDLIGTVSPHADLTSPPANSTTAVWNATGAAVQTDFFTAAEKAAIVSASLPNPTLGADADNVTATDKIFLPAADVVEAVYPTPTDRKSVNTRYVMSYENTTSAPEDDDWLTRSHSTAPFPGYVTQITRGTGALAPEAVSTKKAIRPALYLDRDRVLMVSESKSTGISSSFTATSLVSPSTTLKLTLIDDGIPTFTVTPGTSANANGYIEVSGGSLGLTYGGGSVASNSCISCLLEDNDGIKYYTKAVDYSTSSTSTTLNFTGVDAGVYTLIVFNEIVNDTDKPDYASVPVSFNIVVGSNSIVSPEINPGETLSNGFIGRAYDDTVKLSAGTLPVVFTVDASTLLPSGLTLNASTGRITGTPTATCEDHEVKIKAQNPGGSDEKEFTFTIRQIVPPVITTPAAGAIANGYLSIPYSLTFELQSGTGKPTVKFYLTTGSVLPAGLTLEPNGQLHGTPTSVETQNFTICAETEGEYDYRSYTISILVAPSNPDFLILPEFSPSNGETLPQAKENMPYTELAVQITGSQYMDVQYDPSTFPTGMTFDPYARKILGTPIQGTAGEYHLHLWAKNPATKPASSTGPDSVGVLYELVVQPAAVPLITTQSLPAAAQGEPYSADIETDDAGAALQLQGGILPSGVTFTPAAPAVVAGTPASPGTYTFKVKASNAEGSSSKDFTLTVQPAMPPPVIDPFTLPEGTAGEAYTGVTLTAVNSPTTWSWTGAPPGLVLGNSGTVSGIPTAYGVYNVTFTASNAWGSGASVSASVVIRQSPLSVPPTLVSAVSEAVEGQAYRAEVFLFNRSDIVWTLESGSLPFGLTFEDGVISGTPLGEGKYVITVKASSAGGHFTPVTKELTIWIMSFREEYRSREVALPSIAGMTTDLEPNVYYVKSGDDFSFVLTPHDAGVTPEVTTNRLLKPDSTGVSVTPNSDGVSYTVVIRDIREDVLINAVPSATAPVESAAKVVWSEKGRLFLSVTATAEARIRNVTGQLVKTVSVEPFRTAVVALPAGLYIVELNSGTVYKVLIH